MNKMRLIVSFLLGVSLLGLWTAYAQEDPNCPGAPLPRLSVGAQGRVVPESLQSIMRDAGQGTGILGMIRAGNVFVVLDGPVCANQWNWWQIEYDTHVGWIIEGSGSEYWLEPYEAGESEVVAETPVEPVLEPSPTTEDASVSSFNPPIAVVNVLEVGAQARVLNDDPNAETVTLNIRAEPGRSGAPLAQALEGDLLTIIGGPQEVDGLRWWQVETAGGTEGWVIEGLVNADRGDTYERTLLALCPAEGERIVYRLADYIVTSGADGSDPCVLDYVDVPAWLTFNNTAFNFDNQFVVSPDGEYILYTAGTTMGTESNTLYRLKQDGSERLALTHDVDVYWAAWSPDGERIAIASDQIGIMRPDGSSFSALAQGDINRSWVAWLLDNETVVYVEQDRWNSQNGIAIEYALYRVNILEGGLREIIRTTTVRISDVKVSPDGTMLAVSGLEFSLVDGYSGDDPVKFYGDVLGAVTWIIDLETDEPVLESDQLLYSFVWMPDSSALVGFDEGSLEVLPPNGDEAYTVELAGDLPEGWDFLRWESDTVFLTYLGYGFEVEPDDYGIWAVDVATGEVERRF